MRMMSILVLALLILPCILSSHVGLRKKRRRGSNLFAPPIQLETVTGCQLNGIDFSTFTVNTDGSRRCFTQTFNNGYTYRFTIPVCGTTISCSSPFAEGAIGQFDSFGASYNLGSYSSWGSGFYQGQPAVNITYLDGTNSGCGYSRSSTVYILCDVSAGDYTLSVTENPGCIYTILVYTSNAAICSVLNSAAPTYSPTQLPSVYPTPSPTVNCRRSGVDLTTFVTTAGVQNCFIAAGAKYYFSFPIPACGGSPSYCSAFGATDMTQLGSIFGSPNYNAGTFSDNWSLTSYLNKTALSVSYVSGDVCQAVSKPRNSTVYVICDRQATYVSISASEVSNCSYVLVMSTADELVCSALSPQATIAPSPAPTYQTSPPGAIYGGYDPVDPECPCNQRSNTCSACG